MSTKYNVGDIVQGHTYNGADYTYLVEDIGLDTTMIKCYFCTVLETGVKTEFPVILMDRLPYRMVA